jgi:hypothetical protein
MNGFRDDLPGPGIPPWNPFSMRETGFWQPKRRGFVNDRINCTGADAAVIAMESSDQVAGKDQRKKAASHPIVKKDGASGPVV